jgi:hypothetical protein
MTDADVNETEFDFTGRFIEATEQTEEKDKIMFFSVARLLRVEPVPPSPPSAHLCESAYSTANFFSA